MSTLDSRSGPTVSGHAQEHFWDRADQPTVTTKRAWESGQRIEAGGPLRNFDELRIHWPTRTLLGRTGHTIRTVYDLDGLEESYRHAISHVLEDRS